ncbi:MAG TPA: NAD(P)/FAD-dependent oxidoreductase [Roseiflexaceae bacterium]|nr:NAD(P)/FAD-dependent oxidoreductase [Roseiflexaceae bacterium]
MRTQTADADIIIIGGGPAGSTLGCLVANGNHTAIIVERADHPREHVGELLTPAVNAVLHRIGLLPQIDAAGFVRRECVGWTMPRRAGAHPLTIPVAQHPPPRALRRYGFNVERDVFDALLLQHARACGVHVLDRTTVRRVVFEHGRAIGVEIQDPSGAIRQVTGYFVVDASGRSSVLGSQLQLLERAQLGRQCAMYAWFRGVESMVPDDLSYALLHILDHHRAWGWQIPLRDGICSIGIVAGCDRFQHRDRGSDEFFQHMIARNYSISHMLAHAQRIRPWRVVSEYSYQLQRLYGSGWLLIGDASGFIDPIFSSGVDIAMHSAVFAYEAILPLLLLGQWSDMDEQFALAKYEDRLRRGTAVWAHAVDLFYQSPHHLRRLAQQQQHIPTISRFLQGNPYAVQNQLMFQQLIDAIPAL